jgi:transcriptional regulator with XRE-family HTH domain
MLKDIINEAVREKLIAKNMSASELAKELNITPQHMSNLLNGKRRWNETLLSKVFQALDIKIQIK